MAVSLNQVTTIRSNYCYMAHELRSRGIEKGGRILLDLECHPVSWIMMRGFSYRYDSLVDSVRMDRR